jgi:hypothetical protein
MSKSCHRISPSVVGLASAWAVARLVRTASDFAAAHRIGRAPARGTPSVSRFDDAEYLRRKGIDLHELVSVDQERIAERRSIARSRALWEVAVALGPLVAIVGLHSYVHRLPSPSTHVT